MVVALGPGKFYGSSLPRPRFYTDVKLNPERLDPPPSVLGPFMSWATEAHWSMGGLSFKRYRLQGRIEGNIERLRSQRDQISKKSHKQHKSAGDSPTPGPGKADEPSLVSRTPSPPPPPAALKRRRVAGLIDEEDDEEYVAPAKKAPVRKLGEDCEIGSCVAERRGSKRAETGAGAEGKMNNRKGKLVKRGRKVEPPVVASATGTRSSPRLVQSGGVFLKVFDNMSD